MITGTMILRNAVKLDYPFEVAIRSLQRVADRVLVSVDPTSEDDTMERVRALGVEVFESVWDLENPQGRNKSGVYVGAATARQTRILCSQVKEGWNLSLQADEVLHEKDVDEIRQAVESERHTGYQLSRLYFFGRLTWMRDNWTVPILRLFRHDCWGPDPHSGAMTFVPVGSQSSTRLEAAIYHYSRVGDAGSISRRVRNLDGLYHVADELVPVEEVPGYTFDLHMLDNAGLKNVSPVQDARARLVPFSADAHPEDAREHYKNYA